MLIKMKENKGFTLVELMIVVAIIGILAAVAVPFYQRYVQKSRLTSLVFPGMHSIETNIAAYYAVNNNFPSDLSSLMSDADTTYFSPSWDQNNAQLTVTISDTNTLSKLAGKTLIATAETSGGKITNWSLSGTLADELGLK